MVERLRNVVKCDTKKTKRSLSEPDVVVAPKRKKKNDIMRRYPVQTNDIEYENEQSLEQHKRGIRNELAKSKPRDSVLLPLMRSTFGERRIFVLHEANSVESILNAYPTFSRPAVVSNIAMHHGI